MAFVVWMTGLPCSGKTTIVREMQKYVPNLAILDGDELREWLSPKDFSREGRIEHNKRVAHLAKLLLKHNVPSGVSLVSPFIVNRQDARRIIGDDKRFFEVYVKCSLQECETRDVKGMYKKARNNEIKAFTGVSDPYEAPPNPDLILDTEKERLEQSVQNLLNFLKSKNVLNGSA